MKNTFKSLDEFVNNIHDKHILKLSATGEWKTINCLRRLLISIFFLKNKYKLNLLNSFNQCFDSLENFSIKFHSLEQSVNFDQWIQAAQFIHSYCEDSNAQIDHALGKLKRKVIALKYRLEDINGGLDPSAAEFESNNEFLMKAEYWKSRQALFWTPTLNSKDLSLLRKACRYKAFIDLLCRDDQLAHDFFNWTIRDGIDPLPFITFPRMVQKIIDANLNGRIGRLGGTHLAVIKTVTPQQQLAKLLTLKMEGVYRNILDESQTVTFKGNYTLSIKEIFTIFSLKSFYVGNLEMFEEGITNWNTHHLGAWNPKISNFEILQLDSPTWWDQLPILEVLSLKEAIERYDRQLDGTQWVVSAKASREYLSLHFDKTHAYLEIAIPISPRDYAIYIFGKFATKFPTGTVEALMMVTVSVLATIAYPDENVFYTQRQHIGYSFVLSPEQGKRFMSSIKEDIKEARRENSIFQMESENCGKWIQTKLEEHLGESIVPNLYRTDLINSEPHGFLGICWRIIRKLPKFCRSKVLAWCHFPLGAWKGRWITDSQGNRVWKSLFASSFWQDGIVHLPSFLHNQIENGIIKKQCKKEKNKKN